MTNKNYTIDDLFSDSGAFNENEVSQSLLPHIGIQKSSNMIFFRNPQIPVDKKIIAYALAKKLLKHKGLVETEMVTALEFHKTTGIKKGTVDPMFKSLKGKGFLVGRGEYEIPMDKIPKVVEILNNLK